MAVVDAAVITSIPITEGLSIPPATLYFGGGRSSFQKFLKEGVMATAIIGLQMAEDAVEGIGDLIRESVTNEQEDYEKLYEMAPTRMP